MSQVGARTRSTAVGCARYRYTVCTRDCRAEARYIAGVCYAGGNIPYICYTRSWASRDRGACFRAGQRAVVYDTRCRWGDILSQVGARTRSTAVGRARYRYTVCTWNSSAEARYIAWVRHSCGNTPHISHSRSWASCDRGTCIGTSQRAVIYDTRYGHTCILSQVCTRARGTAVGRAGYRYTVCAWDCRAEARYIAGVCYSGGNTPCISYSRWASCDRGTCLSTSQLAVVYDTRCR